MTLGDLSYIAAFFDAEGSVSIAKSGHGYHQAAQIVNTHRPTVYWLRENFGGHVYSYDPKKNPGHFGKKRVYTWKIYSAVEMGIFLHAIRPHIRQKKHRVDAVLDHLRGRISYKEAKRRLHK